jgi:hypothetical protein
LRRRVVAALALPLAAGLSLACGAGVPHSDTAASVMLRFARALVAGDFDAAHALLAPPLAEVLPPQALRSRFEAMIEYGGGPATEARVMSAHGEWPDRRPGDAGWAYVAITGDGFSEAVSGVVTEQGRIRELEWGRP